MGEEAHLAVTGIQVADVAGCDALEDVGDVAVDGVDDGVEFPRGVLADMVAHELPDQVGEVADLLPVVMPGGEPRDLVERGAMDGFGVVFFAEGSHATDVGAEVGLGFLVGIRFQRGLEFVMRLLEGVVLRQDLTLAVRVETLAAVVGAGFSHHCRERIVIEQSHLPRLQAEAALPAAGGVGAFPCVKLEGSSCAFRRPPPRLRGCRGR